jgi:hypothetical protein
MVHYYGPAATQPGASIPLSILVTLTDDLRAVLSGSSKVWQRATKASLAGCQPVDGIFQLVVIVGCSTGLPFNCRWTSGLFRVLASFWSPATGHQHHM